ncbi:MAG: divalent-cation tolerance protein CutA [Rhodospirillaceae bacterium]|nr:divalent-cation tolerance protein CutA [Rhodospirillaceae bacterium]
MGEFVMAYITAGSDAEAETIAAALVEEKLAACVNVLGQVASIYRWRGEIEQAREIVLLAKTRTALFDRLRDKVKSLHSYDTPCIVAYPILDGYAPYLDWIRAETA